MRYSCGSAPRDALFATRSVPISAVPAAAPSACPLPRAREGRGWFLYPTWRWTRSSDCLRRSFLRGPGVQLLLQLLDCVGVVGIVGEVLLLVWIIVVIEELATAAAFVPFGVA